MGECAPAEGWRVARRDDGFGLDRDLTKETQDAETRASPERTRWRNLAHEVRFEADGSYVVTDVDRRVRADTRGPSRGVSRSTTRGRKIGGGFSMTFKSQEGGLKRVGESSYDLSAGRKLVEREAKAGGMTKYRAKLGWEGWTGLFAVALVVVGGLVVGVLALVAALP